MHYPRIFLAIDNCFASKRWTRPMDWAHVISDLGVRYIEASADTELDPLFMGRDYLQEWTTQVLHAERETGVRVINLYSGHGTYCTLGLTHTDERVRRRLIDDWFKVLIDVAAQLDAGIGFFAHGFADYVLQDRVLYNEYFEILINNLAELCTYAEQAGCRELGLEQMYSPHQVPWRIDETKGLLREVTKRSGSNFYITEDVGHHHKKFIAPNADQIMAALSRYRHDSTVPIWLGTDKAYRIFETSTDNGKQVVEDLLDEIAANQHMFAKQWDGDCYEWLRELGCYSPIVHLQQTNGFESAHKHFTPENNISGKINGRDVLNAIKQSYDKPEEAGMPQRCSQIFLTLEAFTATASINHDTLSDFRKSVQYWRQYIPRDGMTIDELV